MRKYFVIILLIACVSLVGLSYGQAAIFKQSEVSISDRELILKNLEETKQLDPSLLKRLQNDSISMIRIYSADFDAYKYTFKKAALPFLTYSLELIWFMSPTKNGDSLVAVCEKYDGKCVGKYDGLQPASLWEKEMFTRIEEWQSKISLSNKSLFFITGQNTWHLLSNQEVYVIDSCKKVKFSTFYKKKYGSIEAFRKSFIIGGE